MPLKAGTPVNLWSLFGKVTKETGVEIAVLDGDRADLPHKICTAALCALGENQACQIELTL